MNPARNLIHVAPALPRAAVDVGHGPFALAVAPEADALPLAQIPYKSRRWIVHFQISRNVAVLRVMRNPRSLFEIGGHRRVAPAVPVGADLAVAVEVVQQNVIA